MGLVGALCAALALALTASGCGSSKPQASNTQSTKTESNKPQSNGPGVELQGDTQTTGGKALFFTASTGRKLSAAGGYYALELRGVNLMRPHRATFAKPDYLDRHRCVEAPCEWTLIPDAASTYDFRAFLIDLRTNKSVRQSQSVHIAWAASPRPHALRLLVNGAARPTTPLDGEDYSDLGAGKMHVEARWATDAHDTGYYLTISIGRHEYARCSTGTSCPVADELKLHVDQEVSWTVKLLTTRGDKIVDGFKVCLTGRA